MNHLTAAQKGEDGGWHYVSLNRRLGGHPLGYCAEHEPHATEVEARTCYGLWLRAHVRLTGQLASWSDCMAAGCENPTKTFADVQYDGFRMAPLCSEHLNHDEAVKALGIDGPAGDRWQS